MPEKEASLATNSTPIGARTSTKSLSRTRTRASSCERESSPSDTDPQSQRSLTGHRAQKCFDVKELYSHGNWFVRRVLRPLQNEWATIKTFFRRRPRCHAGSALPPFVTDYNTPPYYPGTDTVLAHACSVNNKDFRETGEALDKLRDERIAEACSEKS